MQTTPGTPLTAKESAPGQPGRPVIGLWLSIVVFVYLLDQLTKWWAERALSDGQSRTLIGDLLQLQLAHNPGAAFSTGTSYTVVLTVIALVVVAVIVKLASRLRSRAWAIALGLVLGGALGNVTDRLFREPAPFRGHVVDFLELPHWPIFNVADMAISCAAVLFIVLSLKGIRLDGTRVGATPDEPAGSGTPPAS